MNNKERYKEASGSNLWAKLPCLGNQPHQSIQQEVG